MFGNGAVTFGYTTRLRKGFSHVVQIQRPAQGINGVAPPLDAPQLLRLPFSGSPNHCDIGQNMDGVMWAYSCTGEGTIGLLPIGGFKFVDDKDFRIFRDLVVQVQAMKAESRDRKFRVAVLLIVTPLMLYLLLSLGILFLIKIVRWVKGAKPQAT